MNTLDLCRLTRFRDYCMNLYQNIDTDIDEQEWQFLCNNIFKLFKDKKTTAVPLFITLLSTPIKEALCQNKK